MEQRNTHCFHEGNFTYLKNKAKYGRTGYFSSYAFTLIYPVFTLFNLDIYQKVFASDMFWFGFLPYTTCFIFILLLAFRYGKLLKEEAGRLENDFQSVARFIFLFQRLEFRLKSIFMTAAIMFLLFSMYEKMDSNVFFLVLMLLQLWWRSSLTKIDEWNKS